VRQTRQEAAILDLSDSAVAAMRSLIAGSGDKDIVGIRIAVCGSGCAGLSYQMGLEAEARHGDTVIRREDVTVFVDEESGTLLSGTTVDFCCNPEGFIFENPNACGSCGSRSSCGN